MATTSTDRFGGAVTETTGQRFTGIAGGLSGHFRPAFFAGNYFAADFLRGDTLGRSGPAGTDRFGGTVAGDVTQRYSGILS